MKTALLSFDELFEKLGPRLKQFEKVRRRTLRQEKEFFAFAALGLVIICLGLIGVFRGDSELRILWVAIAGLGVATIIISLHLRHKRIQAYKMKYKREIIGSLVNMLDPSFIYKPDYHIEKRAFIKAQFYLPGEIGHYTGDDMVTGKLGDTEFRFSELEIKDPKRNNEDSPEILFRGIFLEADFHKFFKGFTVVLPVESEHFLKRLMAGKKRNGGERIRFEDVEFDQNFIVYSTDPVEARYILSTKMIQDINDLNRRFSNPVYVSFFGSDLYLGINWKNDFYYDMLDINLRRPAHSKDMIFTFYEELMTCIEFIEDLNLNTRIWSKRPGI